jgi:three-Cys-motif partner protein
MPVGTSGVTRLKWERLGTLLDVHIRMVKGVFARLARTTRDFNRSYHYFDLYAGPGFYSPRHSAELAGLIGSPLIAIRRLKASGLPFIPYLADADIDICDDLRASLIQDGFAADDFRVIKACCAGSVDHLLHLPSGPNRYGLMFVDPNGYPDWAALRELMHHPRSLFHCVDILINLNATVHKRCLGSSLHDEERRPTEYLKGLKKDYISLWNPGPANPHQFTLAYLTNQKRLEFRGQDFHAIDSPHGKAIVRLIDHTREERLALDPIPGLLPGMESALLDRPIPAKPLEPAR